VELAFFADIIDMFIVHCVSEKMHQI